MNVNRVLELALAQLSDYQLEIFQLRMMLECEREHVDFLEPLVKELEREIAVLKAEQGCMLNQIREQQERIKELEGMR